MTSPPMIAERLFLVEPEPVLIGGRSRETGAVVFPCPADEARFEPVMLPRKGNLWSWTVQRFRPKTPPYAGPEEFEPYAVGYIELPGAVIVEARLVDVDFDSLRLGMTMEVTTASFSTDQAGQPVLAYAFRPADRENGK